MATHQLDRTQWKSYFDLVSRDLGGRHAEVETAGLGLGAQINQEWTELNGLSYDPNDDIFEVATETLDHLILHPQEIFVDESGLQLQSIEVIDEDGNHQIVKLKEPLALPAPL
jgi:hypothetical protein